MKRLISILALLGAAATADAQCLTRELTLGRDTTVIEIFRVYSGTDGKSYGELIKLQGSQTTYLGAVLTQFGLGDPSNVVIVHGPPNFAVPSHPAPYREMFLILSGSSTVILSGGQRHELKPGSVVLFEDTSGQGHAGEFGPCGYVALDLQFKPAATAKK